MFTDIEPGSDPRLAAVFAAAKAPAELPLRGEAEALAAYRKPAGKSWFAFRGTTRPAQLIAAALFGGFVVAGGVATAATGTLPLVGTHHSHSTPSVSPSTSDASTDGQDATSSADDEATGDTTVPETGGPGSAGHPVALGSVAKGVATCTKASHDTCQAGQHGKALAAHDSHGTSSLPPAATTHRSGPATGAQAAAAHRQQPSHLTAGSSSSHRRG